MKAIAKLAGMRASAPKKLVCMGMTPFCFPRRAPPMRVRNREAPHIQKNTKAVRKD